MAAAKAAARGKRHHRQSPPVTASHRHTRAPWSPGNGRRLLPRPRLLRHCHRFPCPAQWVEGQCDPVCSSPAKKTQLLNVQPGRTEAGVSHWTACVLVRLPLKSPAYSAGKKRTHTGAPTDTFLPVKLKRPSAEFTLKIAAEFVSWCPTTIHFPVKSSEKFRGVLPSVATF